MDDDQVHVLADPEDELERAIDPDDDEFDEDDVDPDEYSDARGRTRSRERGRERGRKLTLDDLDEISHNSIDLEKVPRRLWEQTLAPLHRQQRYSVARRVADDELREVAGELAFALDMAECQRANEKDAAHHRARRTGYPLPTPRADPAVTGAAVQVNIRLRADDHERLAAAAGAVGMKPTTLGRALILNGAARILQEHAAGPSAANGSTPNARLSLTA